MEAASESPPWSARLVNALGGLVGNRLPRIDADALEAAARAAAGLDDFGPRDYRAGLEALCASANEGDLATTGRFALIDSATRALVMRLVWAGTTRARPPSAPIAPLVVLGIPRSGTTFLHRLLCTDPVALPLLAWQVQRPLPPMTGPDRRVELCRQQIVSLKRAAPGLDRKQQMDALEPDECMTMFDPSFRSLTFFFGYPVWAYQNWYMAADQTPAYEMYRDFLGYLQEGSPDRRLTLKAPVHTLHLDALWAAIPDARVVQTQRDPATVAGRMCSLWSSMHGITARKVDRHRLGQSVVDLLTTMVERSRRVRAAHPEKKVIDVTYRELLDAPMETVIGIYEGHGLAAPADLEDRLRKAVGAHKLFRHGRDDYNLSDYGLTADGVRERVR